MDSLPEVDDAGEGGATGFLEKIMQPFSAATAEAQTVSRTICVNWLHNFEDADLGEDFVTQGGVGWGWKRARFANAAIMEGTTVKWDGNLDHNGCTTVSLPPGSYFVLVGASMKQPNEDFPWVVTVWVNANEDDAEALRAIPFSLESETSKELWVQEFDPISKIGAVLQRVAVRNDNGLMLNQEYVIYAQNQCPRPTDIGDPCTKNDDCKSNICHDDWGVCLGFGACVAPKGGVQEQPLRVYLGIYDDLESVTRYKTVIAHEFGHLVQLKLFDINAVFYGDDAPQELCQCTHVRASNQTHCLQSRERGSGAQREGWAHFYAAKMFNKQNEDNCTLAYYKEFCNETPCVDANGDPNPVTVEDVPNPRSCFDQVRWMDNNCSAGSNDQGVENDWMGFLWNVNRGTNKYTTSDLEDVYDGASNVSPTTWAGVEQSSEDIHGQFSPKHQKLVTDANEYGVDIP